MKTGAEIIQEALEVAYQDRPKSFLEMLFHIEPSESKLKSAAIMHITNRFLAEEDRANKAEQNMYQGIRECLKFIECVDPEKAREIGTKYLTSHL